MDVSAMLQMATGPANEAGLASPNVESRPLEPDLIDTGNLLLVETNEVKLSPASLSSGLQSLARDNAQLLLNQLWKLPRAKKDEVLLAELPKPEFRLPREKPLPTPRPPTKWEQYAKSKGIVKKKKTKLVWDDVVNQWVPRFGFKKAKAEDEKNWMMEYKGTAPDTEDPFEKASTEKKERVAKNEMQRLRNIARAKKVKVPGVGLTPTAISSKGGQGSEDLKKAADLAKKSTASLGKFQKRLRGSLEKQSTKMAESVKSGSKRKFEPLIDKSEKDRNLKVLEQMARKKPKVDVTKAVGQHIFQENREAAMNGKKGGSKKGKKGKRGAMSSRGKGAPSGNRAGRKKK